MSNMFYRGKSMNTSQYSDKIKYVRDRKCFSVSVDYKKYDIFRNIAEKNQYIKEYWEGNPITFIFISVENEEFIGKSPDYDNCYYAYIGSDGDNNIFDLGAWGGSKEEIIQGLTTGDYFFKYIEQYPNGFDSYRLNQYIKYMESMYEEYHQRLGK